VLKEVLNMPDNVPEDLLPKTECAAVFPSVERERQIIGQPSDGSLFGELLSKN
jgi:hypothetical protein